MSLRGSTWFCIFLTLAGIMFTVYALTLHPLQASLLGLFTGPLLVLLGLLQLRKEFKELRADRVEHERGEGVGSDGAVTIGVGRRFLQLVVWLAGLVLMIYLLGFLVAIPIFLLVFLKCHETSWIKAVLIAAITTGLIYGLFEAFLEREFWRGWLGIF